MCLYMYVNAFFDVEHVLYESLARKPGWRFTGRVKYGIRISWLVVGPARIHEKCHFEKKICLKYNKKSPILTEKV